MNWFVKEVQEIVTNQDDRCEHLKDGDVSAKRVREMDSFGPVDSYCMCEACAKDYDFDNKPRKVTEDHARAIHIATTRALLAGITLDEGDNRVRADFLKLINEAKSFEYQEVTEGKVFQYSQEYRVILTMENGEKEELHCTSVDDNVMTRHDFLMTLNFSEPITIHPVEYYDQEGCTDCKQMFFQKDLQSWKWYDFYAPQGDTPLRLCPTCITAPKHIERVQNDNAAQNADYGDDDGIDYSDYDD